MNKNFLIKLLSLFRKTTLRRGSMFAIILLVALLAFEVFNYSTTDFALTDLLGKDLTFAGLRWATILSIAFCGIDFAGIARLFTPEKGHDEPTEIWYLFGAWILAAGMNATLTWWGVAVAVNGHTALGSAILGHEMITKIVPVFVAVMVWVIRLLLIGTFSMAGERLFEMVGNQTRTSAPRYEQPPARPMINNMSPRSAAPASRPQSSVNPSNTNPSRPTRPEPSYHPVGMAAKSHEDDQAVRR
jgi:hypothetical protein